VYITTIHSVSPLGPRVFFGAISELLSGAVIPLPFFPDGVRKIVELLPFASGQNVQLRIYSGNLAGAEMGRAMLLQLFWTAALILGGMLWLRASEKKIVVQGG
ncbi:MAG TPA: ABC transporter permease, partial [Clostridia bacterium]|nr:ABC transporter permease [Clostridia bacterium]